MTGARVSDMKKSRASLGSITAIDRTRVAELQNPEEDRPLAAHWRASCPNSTLTFKTFKQTMFYVRSPYILSPPPKSKI